MRTLGRVGDDFALEFDDAKSSTRKVEYEGQPRSHFGESSQAERFRSLRRRNLTIGKRTLTRLHHLFVLIPQQSVERDVSTPERSQCLLRHGLNAELDLDGGSIFRDRIEGCPKMSVRV